MENLLKQITGLGYGYMWRHRAEFKDLKGKTFTDIHVVKSDDKYDDECILFKCDNGDVYYMYHEQDCCESVTIEDINGDIDCLLNTPILLAEGIIQEGETDEDYDDSETWTFYKLGTVKGYVDIRWYGASNGYYSEYVDLVKVERADLK